MDLGLVPFFASLLHEANAVAFSFIYSVGTLINTLN